MHVIEGFEGRYGVTRSGEVMDLFRGRQLKATSSNGALNVRLVRPDGSPLTIALRKLVAQSFHPNPNGYKIIISLDGDIDNIHADNLEWSPYRVSTGNMLGGVIRDKSTYFVDGKFTRAGVLWNSMIQRCYGKRTEYNKAYDGCEVSKEWMDFNTFEQDIKELVGYNHWVANGDVTYGLDKDVLDGNNTVYSKETCMFIPKEENSREAALRRWGVHANDYKKAAVGQVFENAYGKYTVIEVNNSRSVKVRFHDTGSVSEHYAHDVRRGTIKDPSFDYVLRDDTLRVGEIYESNRCGKVEVIEVMAGSKAKVKFLNSGIEKVFGTTNIRKGVVLDGTEWRGHDFVGKVFKNRLNQEFEVIGYTNATDIDVRFLFTGYETKVTTQTCQSGDVADKSEVGYEFKALFQSERKQDRADWAALQKGEVSVDVSKSKRERLVEEFVGQTFPTNKSGNIIVLSLNNSKDVLVRFLDTGNEVTTTTVNIRNGIVKDRK